MTASPTPAASVHPRVARFATAISPPRTPWSPAACVTVIVGRLGEYNGHGVAQVLGSDPRIEVIARDLDRIAVAQAVAQHKPRVVVVNPETEVAIRERVRSGSGKTELLVLASRPALAYGMRLLAAGVACLPLHTQPAGLIATVRRLARGERVFQSLNGRIFTDTAYLTPRELEVLGHLSDGLAPDAIAVLMNVRVRTVRKHTESLRYKLGVRTTRALVAVTRHD
jgi:DNA-binding NarL/FixJ family response regulator